ncbi:recombinase family protein [Streptomyces sp. NPDC018972]|uniref:recombinase family protein n=1 Tax=Streptomyces sp. NPDC018972 TaxID=3365060 RepID=UPI0037A0D3E6
MVDIVADEGFSGSLDHTRRPDVKKLMRQARMTPRPFDVVTVYEDRAIGRKGRAFWLWVRELQDLGVFTAVAVGGHDNTTERGRIPDAQGRRPGGGRADRHSEPHPGRRHPGEGRIHGPRGRLSGRQRAVRLPSAGQRA